MIRLFINAISASAGGGLTYVRNVVPRLAARDDVHTTLLVSGALGEEFAESERVTVVREDWQGNSAIRMWREQRVLPALIRRSQSDVLLSTGNFALYRSPVPQILLSRNALYLSADFMRDLRQRGEYRLWLDTVLKSEFARSSIRAADCTVAPSAAFARDLQRWTGKDVICIHHGFDSGVFFSEDSTLPPSVLAGLQSAGDSLRLLFVSHYNYYRNFETLIQAIAILKRKLRPRTVRLFLTCKLDSASNPGDYRAEGAAQLVRRLGLANEIIELDAIPYRSLHRLYQACDFYVTPAYAETFAHPLVEAMASGLPVIASDLEVHREICGEAALYFSRFSPEELAAAVGQAADSVELASAMRGKGQSRSRDFSWDGHVEQLLRRADALMGGKRHGS